jgi:branched-subunit amino acid aminotransferase/4-amino-4-deoxychorismate lyase
MSRIVFLDGVFLPAAEAGIRIDDAGFLWGYALFETMRGYGGKIFRLADHLKRLAAGAEALLIPFAAADWEKRIETLLKLNDLPQARVRLTLSAGPAGPAWGKAPSRPTVLLTAVPYEPPSPEAYRQGWGVHFSPYRRYSQSPLSGLKSANYLESFLARQEAGAAGFEEAILLNEKGFVAEAAGSNLFIVREDILQTPGKNSGALPGITRGVVLELADGLGIPAREKVITKEEVTQANEIFLTNSLIEIMPVSRVGEKEVGRSQAGGITALLQEAYRGLVRKECRLAGEER